MSDGIFFMYVVKRYLRKHLIELTKLAKISCKLCRHGVIPDPFLELSSSKMEQMKGIDAMKKKCVLAILLLLPVGDI